MRYKISHLAESTGKGVNTRNRKKAVLATFLLWKTPKHLAEGRVYVWITVPEG